MHIAHIECIAFMHFVNCYNAKKYIYLRKKRGGKMGKKNKLNSHNSIALDLIKAYKKQFYVVTSILSIIIILLLGYIATNEKHTCFCDAHSCAVEVEKYEKDSE